MPDNVREVGECWGVRAVPTRAPASRGGEWTTAVRVSLGCRRFAERPEVSRSVRCVTGCRREAWRTVGMDTSVSRVVRAGPSAVNVAARRRGRQFTIRPAAAARRSRRFIGVGNSAAPGVYRMRWRCAPRRRFGRLLPSSPSSLSAEDGRRRAPTAQTRQSLPLATRRSPSVVRRSPLAVRRPPPRLSGTRRDVTGRGGGGDVLSVTRGRV